MAYALSFVASALLWWFGRGLEPVWWMAWLAPLPLLWVAPRLRGLAAFGLAFAAGAVGAFNMDGYLALLDAPWFVRIQAAAMPGLVFGLSVLLWRALSKRGWHWAAALAFPALWTALEFLQSEASIHGTFGSLAYSQMQALAVIQVASWTGLAGVTFVVLLGAAAVATRRREVMLGAGTLVLLVVGVGLWRLNTAESTGRVKVGLASLEDPKWRFPRDAAAATEMMRAYGAEVTALARQGAQAVVLPEKLAKLEEKELPVFDGPLGAAAREAGVEVAAGLERWNGAEKRNEIRWYGRSGRVENLYEKQHMLPPFESHLVVGTEEVVLMRGGRKWGLAICKDMDFPALSRGYGRAGAGLLLVPAWDFERDAWLHGRMAVMRGVESGFGVVRASKQGTLAVSDSRGRVLAEARGGRLVTEAVVGEGGTFYARYGDWFGWLSVAAAAALLVALRRPARV